MLKRAQYNSADFWIDYGGSHFGITDFMMALFLCTPVSSAGKRATNEIPNDRGQWCRFSHEYYLQKRF